MLDSSIGAVVVRLAVTVTALLAAAFASSAVPAHAAPLPPELVPIAIDIEASPCFENGLPAYGTTCDAQPANNNGSPGASGMVLDLDAPSGVCSDTPGSGDLANLIGFGSTAPCTAGDLVFRQTGNVSTFVRTGLQNRFSRDGECDATFGDGDGLDEWDEMLVMEDGSTPVDASAPLLRRDCLAPRLVDVIVVTEWLTTSGAAMPLVYFGHMLISGCVDNLGTVYTECTLTTGSFSMRGMLIDLVIDEDADDDGMTDRYENGHSCLDPDVADADGDPDADLIASNGEHPAGTLPCVADSDADHCADGEELGVNHVSGGQRDPANPWDFYDVNATSRIDAADIGLVRSKFNGSGPTPPADVPYDRSAGDEPWAPNAPDNKIDAVDVGHVRASFNDNCQAPP